MYFPLQSSSCTSIISRPSSCTDSARQITRVCWYYWYLTLSSFKDLYCSSSECVFVLSQFASSVTNGVSLLCLPVTVTTSYCLQFTQGKFKHSIHAPVLILQSIHIVTVKALDSLNISQSGLNFRNLKKMNQINVERKKLRNNILSIQLTKLSSGMNCLTVIS